MNSFYALRSAAARHSGEGDAADMAVPFEVKGHSADIDCIHIRCGTTCGVLLGNLFERESMQPVRVDRHEHLALDDDVIRSLLHRYWGRYVALIVEGEAKTITLFRDPSGQLPVYWTLDETQLRISSNVTGLGTTPFMVDWEGVVQHLVHQGHRTARTGLQGVNELAPGAAATFSTTGHDLRYRWKPKLNNGLRYQQTEVLAEELRGEVESIVLAWQQRFNAPILTLSGGLDSSIIAACLRSGGVNVTGLNLVSGVGLGDESKFAAAVAEMWALHLQIVEISPSDVDLRYSSALDRPRPVTRGYTQASDKAAALAAKERLSTAHFNGGGGDNIFGFLHSSYPAADALLDAGAGLTYRRTVQNLARLTTSNVWTIGFRSLRHAMLARSANHARRDTSLLSPAYINKEMEQHPWMSADKSGRPGHRQHLSHVLEAIHYSEYLGQNDTIPTIYPLLSQPLMEYCLSIPSWRWSEHGRDRSLARAAFAPLLPQIILDRRIKGSFEHFLLNIFYRNMSEIRLMVAEGQLAKQGIIDSKACLDALSRPDRLAGATLGRILHFVDVEAWLSGRAGVSTAS